MTKGLTYSLIKKAVSGDEIAINRILKIYEPYINTLVSEPVFDSSGNEYIGINVDLKDCLQSKLIQVVQTFKIA